MISRRGLLTGLTAALAAPAIVRIDNIMPVRNRLIVPKSYLYEPAPVYTFSCYLKSDDGPMAMVPSERVQSLSAAGRGWYRYSTEISCKSGEDVTVHLPSPKVWGVQLRGPMQPTFGVKLKHHNDDGILLMPSSGPTR
jgi:hypothetical protein